jgi:hypothetical protein
MAYKVPRWIEIRAAAMQAPSKLGLPERDVSAADR